jgi:hypothetical protein
MTNRIVISTIANRSLIWAFAFAGVPLVMTAIIVTEQMVGVLSPTCGILLFVALFAQIFCLRHVWYPKRGWPELMSALMMGVTFATIGLLTVAIIVLFYFGLEGVQ